jgi:hypothetical protein
MRQRISCRAKKLRIRPKAGQEGRRREREINDADSD